VKSVSGGSASANNWPAIIWKLGRGERRTPLHAELVFEVGRVHESDVWDAVRDQIDLCHRSPIGLLQYPLPASGHYDQPRRELDERFHNPLLLRARLTQHGVECRHHRHAQLPQKRQNVGPRASSIDSVLMLEADDVYVADVQEVRCAQIGREVMLFHLESNDVWIRISFGGVVHGDDETLTLRVRRGHRLMQVGSVIRNAAFSRQMIADEGDPAYPRCFFHSILLALTM
jgi:hypothetical protein